MKTYKLKDDYVNGYIPDSGGKLNILFKRGDIVQGELKKGKMWNREWDGIYAKPTISTAYVENGDTEVFIPLTYLVEDTGETAKKIDIKKILLFGGIAVVGYLLVRKFIK
jgi:hypothetical protein